MKKPEPQLLELLAWIAHSPRTYAETMEAWRTTCPRFSAWEDAWVGGLVSVERRGAGVKEQIVSLTPLGTTVLEETTRQTQG